MRQTQLRLSALFFALGLFLLFGCAAPVDKPAAEARATRASLHLPSCLTTANALSNIGLCSLTGGNSDAAQRYFSQALSHDSMHRQINAQLGQMYVERRDDEKLNLTASLLWRVIYAEHKLDNRAGVVQVVALLDRQYPASTQYAAHRRGVFDE
ncbi:hypothetical protein RGU70_09750 [Herbaspirillum sp. RTI4]|uniref:hypothetical protein n=1 Tax=Herbaspirillum sp. RTI4 TaxID=3048640 RepID=UPI002AB384EC|nr:hypothetical protein [Herbaspirillum sp. RTI4]MDY7578607.1 hypothetical protein [Herbaspirillum sp. RTI4]MEA9981087.1 hypothetical protein [Herbaspirillum sp. RTI4]